VILHYALARPIFEVQMKKIVKTRLLFWGVNRQNGASYSSVRGPRLATGTFQYTKILLNLIFTDEVFSKKNKNERSNQHTKKMKFNIFLYIDFSSISERKKL
jgi:hypothetical protein